MLSVDEQLKIITSGTMQIVPLDELKKKLEKGCALNIKLGVDPTSPDLHLGHAVPLRKMRQFQDLGHKVTLIIGNGTALIGDPSGRDSTRPPLTEQQVEENAKTYVAQAMKVLDPEKTTIVYNGEWLKPMQLSDMLGLMSQFNVARILEREDFHNRYTNGMSISLHEFIYPVLQAYDSVVINADVEMGGNDQIFNLLAGRDLMRAQGMEPQVALTMPTKTMLALPILRTICMASSCPLQMSSSPCTSACALRFLWMRPRRSMHSLPMAVLIPMPLSACLHVISAICITVRVLVRQHKPLLMQPLSVMRFPRISPSLPLVRLRQTTKVW